MRIPITTEATELVDTLEAFGYQRLIDRMIWTWTDKGWHLKFSGARNEHGYLPVKIDRHATKYLGLNPGPNTKPQAYVHRLEYALHIGDLPEGGIRSPLTVDHVDDDKTNDYPTNLRVMTRTGNRQKARPYGTGYCDMHGHPIVGANALRRKDGRDQCRWCRIDAKRHYKFKTGRNKTYTPMPPFWLWMLSQYADAPDPELAMMHDTGLLVPVVI